MPPSYPSVSENEQPYKWRQSPPPTPPTFPPRPPPSARPATLAAAHGLAPAPVVAPEVSTVPSKPTLFLHVTHQLHRPKQTLISNIIQGDSAQPRPSRLVSRVLQAQVDSCRAEADAAQAEANAAQARADLAFLEAEVRYPYLLFPPSFLLPGTPFDVDESTHAVDLTSHARNTYLVKLMPSLSKPDHNL
ncbi:hypothetical protein N7467_002347 [Penicillium canescens]|nr:hypothetical protein N7467_002347 [Penicillium canescens]